MANDPFYSGPLGMPLSENTRRFTVIRPAASGKTQPIDQATLERLREYVMLDLVCSGIVRVDKLPQRVESPLADQVRDVCAAWGRRG